MLLIGAGGLGSPASLYLAAAGVGHLGIIDADIVDESNLQRQIAHSLEHARHAEGRLARSARSRRSIPTSRSTTYRERLTSENIDRILDDGWEIIVDGADNFPTRYLVERRLGLARDPGRARLDLPLRGPGDASSSRTTGPCYRCLFPEPPPPELAPSCSEGGVLGVLPGIVGTLQTNEALKLALGDRRPADRPAAALRRARDRVHRGADQARPRLPRLRRAPDDHRVHRLRRVLRADDASCDTCPARPA